MPLTPPGNDEHPHPAVLPLRPITEVRSSDVTVQPRWARVAASNGWMPPEVLYLMEHGAALETVRLLVEHLTSVLPFEAWLDVAHAANMITDDVASDCPCHPARWADHPAQQDALW